MKEKPMPFDKTQDQSRGCDESSNFLTETTKRGILATPKGKDAFPQVLASCIVHCIVIQAGVNMAYSTILTNGIQQGKDMKLTKDEESWIASLVTISLPLGSLIVGPLMDKFGRKSTCILSCVPAMISWILILTANSVQLIYVARVVAGATGGLTTVGLVYVSEITHPQLRPMLLCLNSVFVSLGILVTCCLGVWLNWRQMSVAFLILNVCIFVGLFFVPESPYWLLCLSDRSSKQKRHLQSERSLKWLNPNKSIFEEEFERIKETSSKNVNNDDKTTSVLDSWTYYSTQLRLPGVYKPLIILFVLLLFQQLSGAYVVIFYAISVFHEIGGSFGGGLNENGALVILGMIRFVMSLLTTYLSRSYGRRTLCIASGLGMAFSMFFSGMLMYITSACDENGAIRETMANQKWLLLVIVLFYVCMSSLGFMAIPWTLIGELLPISIKGVAGGFMVSVAYVMMFAVVKSYPYALASMGAQGVFFFFSLVSLLATGFVYLFLPETLGKTFAEIESYFDPKTRDFGSSDRVV